MDDPYVSIAQIFGPWVQAFFYIGMLLLFCGLIGALAFRGESRLVRTGIRFLWMLPLLVLAAFLLYGILRFSGHLLYPTDGWATFGRWNSTNQNAGEAVIVFCVSLLAGALFAVWKERFQIRPKRS